MKKSKFTEAQIGLLPGIFQNVSKSALGLARADTRQFGRVNLRDWPNPLPFCIRGFLPVSIQFSRCEFHA